MMTSPKTSNLFLQLSDLPAELRLKIWHLAIPDPRIVNIQKHYYTHQFCFRVWSNIDTHATRPDGYPAFFDAEGKENSLKHSVCANGEGYCHFCANYGPKATYEGFQTQCPIPNLLLVCKESFGVASEYYSQAFGTGCSFPKVWFDFKRDTLYLDWNIDWEKPGDEYAPVTLQQLHGSDLSKVENFALFDYPNIDWREPRWEADYEHWLCSLLKYYLLSLRKLTIVIAHLQGILSKPLEASNLVFVKGPTSLPAIGTICNILPVFQAAVEYFHARKILPVPEETVDYFSLGLYGFYNTNIRPLPRVSIQRLEYWKPRFKKLSPKSLIRIPDIDYQVVTTPQGRDLLQKAEERRSPSQMST